MVHDAKARQAMGKVCSGHCVLSQALGFTMSAPGWPHSNGSHGQMAVEPSRSRSAQLQPSWAAAAHAHAGKPLKRVVAHEVVRLIQKVPEA